MRRRTVLASGRSSVETAYGVTSASDRAGPSEILALNCGHWEIENRVHYVRDVAYDEDRSRVRIGRMPRNSPACPTPPSPSSECAGSSATSPRRTANRPTP